MLILILNYSLIKGQTNLCEGLSEKVNDHFEIERQMAFAKVYGYVKYFHPSDEAAILDWDKFAVYGAEQVGKCKTKEELLSTLEGLFHPIAPSVTFLNSTKNYPDFDISSITPPDTIGYKTTFWQHQGVSFQMDHYVPDIYNSIRVNADHFNNDADLFGNLVLDFEAKKIVGKRIKVVSHIKSDQNLSPAVVSWLRFYGKNNNIIDTKSQSPKITKDSNWERIELVDKIPENTTNIRIGTYLYGKGKVSIKDYSVFIEENRKWIPKEIEPFDSENKIPVDSDDKSIWHGTGKGYDFTIKDSLNKGKIITLKYVDSQKSLSNDTIFSAKPNIGESIEKDLGLGIAIQFPLNLFIHQKNGTFPKAVEAEVIFLNKTLKTKVTTVYDESFRIGNVINLYNVFQHFYPYFKEVNIDWDEAFDQALSNSLSDKNMEDHIITLREFGAKLKDGHFRASRIGNDNDYGPPILWEWLKDKFVITKLVGEIKGLKRGDIVTHVNGIEAKEYFDQVSQGVSAATKGYLEEQVEQISLNGEKGSEITIKVNGKDFFLKRDKRYRRKYYVPSKRDSLKTYEILPDNIFYLNLIKLGMSQITELLPELTKAKAIICDVRGRPNRNTGFLSHLLKKNDTTKVWLKVPKIIYPDQENISGYKDYNWSLEAKKPYLGDKIIVFITDARAVSYSESYMGYVKSYNLGTILGETTAGTNGNVNPFTLLGGISIRWTGMKVIQHNATQFHGIGIVPDIPVQRTIEGIRDGKDELLEKAIEVVRLNF